MLDADNLPYEQGKFFTALYDGEQETRVCLDCWSCASISYNTPAATGLLPPPFINRHNEIWMRSHWDDDEAIIA